MRSLGEHQNAQNYTNCAHYTYFSKVMAISDFLRIFIQEISKYPNFYTHKMIPIAAFYHEFIRSYGHNCLFQETLKIFIHENSKFQKFDYEYGIYLE
jgi:hypothetical protein